MNEKIKWLSENGFIPSPYLYGEWIFRYSKNGYRAGMTINLDVPLDFMKEEFKEFMVKVKREEEF